MPVDLLITLLNEYSSSHNLPRQLVTTFANFILPCQIEQHPDSHQPKLHIHNHKGTLTVNNHNLELSIAKICNKIIYLNRRISSPNLHSQVYNHKLTLIRTWYFFLVLLVAALKNSQKSHPDALSWLEKLIYPLPENGLNTDTKKPLSEILFAIQTKYNIREDENESDDSDDETDTPKSWTHQPYHIPTSLANKNIWPRIHKHLQHCITTLQSDTSLATKAQQVACNTKDTEHILKKTQLDVCLRLLTNVAQHASSLDHSESEQRITHDYNDLIAQKEYSKATKLLQKKPIYLAHYRGIHFSPEKMGTQCRRALRLQQPTTYYASAVLHACQQKNQDYQSCYQQDQLPGEKLLAKGKKVVKKLQGMSQIGPLVMPSHRLSDCPYLYNNLQDYLLEAYTLNQARLLLTLKRLHAEPKWQKKIPQYNPFISTSIRARHAFRYAIGLKVHSSEEALNPNYSTTGKASYPHSGKTIIALTRYKGHATQTYANIGLLGDRAQIITKEEHIVEQENSFFGKLEGVFYHHIARFPNFSHSWRREVEEKYGLPKNIYQSLQVILQLLPPDCFLQRYIVKLIAEMMCLFLEPKLIQVAQRQARSLGGMLGYLHPDQTIHAQPPNARLYTKGEAHRQQRNIQHCLRQIRIQLAAYCNTIEKIPYPLLIFTTRTAILSQLRHWATKQENIYRITKKASFQENEDEEKARKELSHLSIEKCIKSV